MRQVHESENLSGKTLTGPARRSLFRDCNIDGLTLKGDWRGTEYYSNVGAADWSQAQTYASYWRDNTLDGSAFPADIGHLHHEPVAEIIRQRLGGAPASLRQKLGTVKDAVKAGFTTASWETTTDWWTDSTPQQRQKLVGSWRKVFAPYLDLLARFEELAKTLQSGDSLWTPEATPLVQELFWPDGTKLSLDLSGGFPAGVTNLYELDEYVFAQAKHPSFTYSGVPLRVMAMPDGQPDWWLNKWSGY